MPVVPPSVKFPRVPTHQWKLVRQYNAQSRFLSERFGDSFYNSPFYRISLVRPGYVFQLVGKCVDQRLV